MEWSVVLVFAGALAIAAGSPGPSIAALVARVLTRGYRDVLPFVAAMWIGESIWLSFAVFGLSAIAHAFGTLFLAIKYAGIAYLFFLAWKMWTGPAEVPGNTPEKSTPPSRMFLAGLAVTLGNPKVMVFYMALLPAIVDLRGMTMTGWLELTLTMLIVLMLVDFAWIALAARARRLLRSPRAVRVTNRVGATVMAAAAAAMAAR